MSPEVAQALRVEAPMIDAEGVLCLPQPCAFHVGNRCDRYEDRPSGCRTFTCETLRQFIAGELSAAEARMVVDDALAQVRAIELELDRSGWTQPGESGSLAWRRFVTVARQHENDVEFRRRYPQVLLLVAAYLNTIQRAFVIGHVF